MGEGGRGEGGREGGEREGGEREGGRDGRVRKRERKGGRGREEEDSMS